MGEGRRRRAAVTIDLQAAQSAGYRDRGVARYAMDFTTALVQRHPGLVERVVLNPDLPPVGVEHLMAAVPVEPAPTWAGTGGIYHILSPFELALDVERLWPRPASQRGMRTVVTVYDLIPELFPDVYLGDPGLRRRYKARRELVRAADHVMTISRSAADDVVTHLGVPASRVTMVGAAPGRAFRRPASRAAAMADVAALLPAVPAGTGFIVYNGAVEPRKNMEALLEAYALLPPGLRERFCLVLVCRMRPLERNHFVVRAEQLGVAGQVVLTGYLPDRALVALYQATDLMVFPSLYEGYGLPVAEAIACGAPAIASGNSSLVELVAPEATFDPSSPATIAAAVEAALTDGDLRARLVAWNDRPQTSWADVADRAATAYRSLEPPAPAEPAAYRWRRRPLLAFVTPWPPSMTGVASYNARLVAALRAYADVEVYVDGDPLEGVDRPGLLPIDDLLRRDDVIGGFDGIVVALGNSEFHAGALRLLRHSTRPPLVQAHDVRLDNLYLHAASRGAVPEGFAGAVAAHYPALAGVADGGSLPGEVAARQGILMLGDIIARSRRLLVTSSFAARVAALDCPPCDRDKIAVWPYAYPAPVDRAPAGVDHHLLCSFGLVNEAKLPDLLVDALALLLPEHPALRLAFVGPAGDGPRQAILSQAQALGIAAAVTVTGALDDAGYEAWLARAGLAVQLRRSTNGESSGAVADCLSHGIPTVASAIGPQSELAEVTAQLPAGAGAADLADVVAGLLADRDGAEALGRRGQAWAEARSFDWAARQLFELLPEVAPHGVTAASPGTV